MVEEAWIEVEVVHALPHRAWRWPLRLPAGATLMDALRAAPLVEAGLDPGSLPAGVGVFGRERPLDHPLRDGDRIEIYRPLLCDPRDRRRQRAGQRPAPSSLRERR
ncbi:MAG: UPF0125 protein [Lysobacteraceae bacterium]|nr:MAG: UPF0125 protein [Xanthomonadaceae bacterium]